MHLVAREARDGRLAFEVRGHEAPRTVGIERGHQVANAAFEVHAVAAQAIVHQGLLAIVLLVEKDALVSGAVRARLPLRELLLMAAAAAVHHGADISCLRRRTGSAKPPRTCCDQAPDVAEMEAGIQRDDAAVTVGALHAAVAGGLPHIVVAADLVAARARGARRYS